MRILGVALLWVFVFPCTALANSTVWVAANEESAPSQDMRAQISSEREELLLFFEEEDLIVTATKRPQTLEQAPAIATVITAEQIRNMGARNLMDIFRTVPGLAVTKGPYGHEEVEVRGIKSLNSEKVKFLIDGHSVNNNITGGFVWGYDSISLDNIKRVEVIRGPGSALYGSNAFVSVINIVTKDGRDMDGVIVTAGGGSFDTGRGNIQAGKKFEELEVALYLDYISTEGARLHVAKDSVGQSGDTMDWMRRLETGLKASYKDFTFNSKYVYREKAPYIGATSALNDETKLYDERYFAELGYRKDLSNKTAVDIKAYVDVMHWEAYWELFPEGIIPGFPDGMIGNPYMKERIAGTELQVDSKLLDNHLMTFGALAEKRNQFGVGSRGNFNLTTGEPVGIVQDVTDLGNWNRDATREIWAIYIQDIWSVTDDVDITLGVRYDDYSDFGGTTNPRVAAVWQFYEGWDAKFMYATAFRAPSFEELYNENNPVALGNPDLGAEKMETYEVSLGYSPDKLTSARISYFNNTFTKQILRAPNPSSPGLFHYANGDGVEVDGIEVEFIRRFADGASIYGNYTYQNPRDKDTGGRLPDTSAHKGNIGTNVALSNYLNFNVNVFLTDERPRGKDDARDPAPGYALVDLTLILKNFYNTFEVMASVHNLFDKKYFDPSSAGTVPGDYPREGINYMLEVRYKL